MQPRQDQEMERLTSFSFCRLDSFPFLSIFNSCCTHVPRLPRGPRALPLHHHPLAHPLIAAYRQFGFTQVVCVCGVTSHVGLLLLLLYCWLWTRRDETRRNEEANGQRGRVGMLHAIRQSSSSPKLRPLHFAPNWKGSRLPYRSAQFLFFFMLEC